MAKSRSVTLTDANAVPNTPSEVAQSLQSCVNALRGTYATGSFDGGIVGSVGYYHKYAEFWEAKLVLTATGNTAITFPYTLVDAVLNIYTISDMGVVSLSRKYAHETKDIQIVLGGVKTIIEVAMVHNTKER